MKKSYKLDNNKKSILEEILERNRKRLARRVFVSNSSMRLKSHYESHKKFTKGDFKSYQSHGKSHRVNTILKAIAFRKSKKSLPILINYILNNASEMYNELGEIITKNKIDEEGQRFNLIEDANNKKAYAKDCKEKSLKHRQILHLMYSLPNNKEENKEKLLALAESFKDIFPDHKYVYGLHSNTNNMHLHIAIKCKNDVTKKRLRIGGKELIAINKYLYNKCQDLGIDLVATNIKKQKQANTKLHKNKLPDFMKKTSPKFVEMYNNDNFPYIDANKSTIDALKKLKLDEENIKKFLWLYNENKKQAIYSINKSPKIFGLTPHRVNTYKKENNNKGFTLRKVEIRFKDKSVNEYTNERKR